MHLLVESTHPPQIILPVMEFTGSMVPLCAAYGHVIIEIGIFYGNHQEIIMKLYFSKGACSLTIRIMINELGLKSQYESVDLKTKKTESGKDFYKINPKGAVPCIELDNGETLTENMTILQYLADTNHAEKLLPPMGNFKRYRTLEWVNFVSTDIHKGFGPLFNSAVPDDLKKSIFIPALLKKFEVINNHLQKNKFLMGDDYTIGDGYLFAMIRWLSVLKIDFSNFHNLEKYFEMLQNRESIKKSLQEESIKSAVV
jgi:glutathione S-transferase